MSNEITKSLCQISISPMLKIEQKNFLSKPLPDALVSFSLAT